MNELKYVITKFDEETKTIQVSFEDNSWAQIRLTNPLPKNQEELENIIKDYAAPVEAIETMISPDADLSYIKNIIDKQQTTTRKSLLAASEQTLDPEVEANANMWEKIHFKNQVSDVLVELGLLQSNPVKLPVSEV